MSRIGKKPVPVGKAKVAVNDHLVKVEGPKGKLWVGSAGGLSLFWPRNGALVSWPTAEAPAGRSVGHATLIRGRGPRRCGPPRCTRAPATT